MWNFSFTDNSGSVWNDPYREGSMVTKLLNVWPVVEVNETHDNIIIFLKSNLWIE